MNKRLITAFAEGPLNALGVRHSLSTQCAQSVTVKHGRMRTCRAIFSRYEHNLNVGAASYVHLAVNPTSDRRQSWA